MIPVAAFEDDCNLEKLAREIVVSRLAGAADASEEAALVGRELIISAVKATGERQHPMVTIILILRGVMGGLLLIDKDMPSAALAILREAGEAAEEIDLERESVMTWALEAIAEISPMMPPGVRQTILAQIADSYNGVGPVFNELCSQALNRPSAFT